jgi:hypothetical protein
MRRSRARQSIAALRALVTFVALALCACDDPQCPDDQFVVEENGSCASSPHDLGDTMPRRFDRHG